MPALRNKQDKVAFLGPVGTYTHQAAFNRFGHEVTYISCSSIEETFNSLGKTASISLLPYENSINGSVVETLNLFRSSRFGETAFIREVVALPIQHCLLVRKGVQLKDIEAVYSHEQALGQCHIFLNSNLPNAILHRVPSTAAAAQMLVSMNGGPEKHSAAICSAICEDLFESLAILYEGVQDDRSNYTRFFALSDNSSRQLPFNVSTNSTASTLSAMVRLSLSGDLKGSPDIFKLMETISLPIAKLDRRPRITSFPFHDDYFLELNEEPKDKSFTNGPGISVDRECKWQIAVAAALSRVRERGGISQLLGIYQDAGIGDT